MTRKELQEIVKLSRKMSDLLITLARDSMTISAKAPDGMPFSQTNSNSDPTSVLAMRAYELHDDFVACYHQIADKINRIDDAKLRTIVRLRYVNLLSWKKVAINMNETKDAVYSYFKRNVTL